MFYWVLKLEWSHTDIATIIVRADTKENALTKQKSNARYVTLIAGPISEIIE